MSNLRPEFEYNFPEILLESGQILYLSEIFKLMLQYFLIKNVGLGYVEFCSNGVGRCHFLGAVNHCSRTWFPMVQKTGWIGMSSPKLDSVIMVFDN